MKARHDHHDPGTYQLTWPLSGHTSMWHASNELVARVQFVKRLFPNEHVTQVEAFAVTVVEWKPGDTVTWRRSARRGWYSHHAINAVLIAPGVTTCGIAILNQHSGEWEPHRVPIKSLKRWEKQA